MSTTKLVIRPEKVNCQGLCIIYVTYTHWGQTVYFSTGEKIPVKYWDKQKCRVKGSFKGFSTLNKVIELKKLMIEEVRRELYLKTSEETVEAVKLAYEESKKPKRPTNLDFFDYQDEYLEYKEKIQVIANGTLRHIRAFFNHMKKFESYRSRKILFSKINEEFYEELISYCLDYKSINPNSASNLVKNLKAYLRYCLKNGYHNDTSFENFKRPKVPSDIIALTYDEFRKLYLHDCSKESHKERVRDLFIFACATGLRFSDFTKVSSANIRDGAIHIMQTKTKKPVVVPLNDYSKNVLDKYEGNLPKFSVQNFNKVLKKVAKDAKIDTVRSITTYKGRISTTEEIPLHQLIRSHMGRKTFISLSLGSMSVKSIMEIVGHNDLSITSKYNALNPIKLKEDMKTSSIWKL